MTKRLKSLFRAMADGGDFGAAEVAHFNGGLFADDDAIDLKPLEIVALHEAARRDWSSVEPSIFGTLFERMLDPGKRSQLGAHYTSRADIETLLRPVLEAPLRREWEAVRAKADKLFEQIRERASTKANGKKKSNPRTEHDGC